jgi:hypothetical protein
MSGLGGARVTNLKINFGFGPNGPRAGPDEILKFWPVQTSTRRYCDTELHRIIFFLHKHKFEAATVYVSFTLTSS